jgi:hypothetical protein
MYPLKIAYSSGRYHLNARQWQRACQMEIIKKKKKKAAEKLLLIIRNLSNKCRQKASQVTSKHSDFSKMCGNPI